MGGPVVSGTINTTTPVQSVLTQSAAAILLDANGQTPSGFLPPVWTSSDPLVLKVLGMGRGLTISVRAVAPGTAQLSFVVDDGTGLIVAGTPLDVVVT